MKGEYVDFSNRSTDEQAGRGFASGLEERMKIGDSLLDGFIRGA